jgi:hypothetical protein
VMPMIATAQACCLKLTDPFHFGTQSVATRLSGSM